MARSRNTAVSLEELTASFKQGKFSPLYLFTGEEEFLVEEYLDGLLEHVVEPSSRSFNLDIVYGADVDVKDVVAMASSFPMMAERRVVVVREAEKLATAEASREILIRYLENPSPTTVFVMVTSKADMRMTHFRIFQQKGVVVDCKRLYDNEIPGWIARRVKRRGYSISLEVCEMLHAHTGNSLRDLQNEIDKLLIYIGDKKTVEAADVSEVVGMSRSFNVFELQKAIGQGDTARSMEILERMLDAGENPIGVIAILSRFFQKLWILPSLQRQSKSDYDLAAKLQVSPYFVREYVAAAKRFPVQRLETSFKVLLDADVALKTTQGDVKLVMTTMLYKVLNNKPQTGPLQ